MECILHLLKTRLKHREKNASAIFVKNGDGQYKVGVLLLVKPQPTRNEKWQ